MGYRAILSIPTDSVGNKTSYDITNDLVFDRVGDVDDRFDETQWDLFSYTAPKIKLYLKNHENRYRIFGENHADFNVNSIGLNPSITTGRVFLTIYFEGSQGRVPLLTGFISNETLSENIKTREISFDVLSKSYNWIKTDGVRTDLSSVRLAGDSFSIKFLISTLLSETQGDLFDDTSVHRDIFFGNITDFNRTQGQEFLRSQESSNQEKLVDLLKMSGSVIVNRISGDITTPKIINREFLRTNQQGVSQEKPSPEFVLSSSSDILSILSIDYGVKKIFSQITTTAKVISDLIVNGVAYGGGDVVDNLIVSTVTSDQVGFLVDQRSLNLSNR